MILIIANILTFIGNTLFTLSTIIKSKRKILLLQSGNHVLASIGETMTGAYTGLIQELANLVRNIIFLFLKIEKNLPKIIISGILTVVATVVGVIVNIYFSDNVWYGYLPIACGLMYSIVVIIVFSLKMNECNGELALKIALLANSIGWSYYGFIIQLYPIFAFNVLNIILCIISIIRIIIVKKKAKIIIIEEEKATLEE